MRKMKKIFAIVLAGTMCALNFGGQVVSAEEDNAAYGSYGDLIYRIETDGTLTIVDCKEEAEGVVVIPSESYDKPITKIEAFAFQNCKDITEVQIPDSVTEIDANAFADSFVQEQQDGPIYTVDSWVVSYDKEYAEVTLPEDIRGIANSTFSESEITKITIPGSVKTIPTNLFSFCENLEEVELNEGTTKIADNAFFACETLKKVNIPKTIEKIEYSAFCTCDSLENVDYAGNLEDWRKIQIDLRSSGNGPLRTATIHCSDGTSFQMMDYRGDVDEDGKTDTTDLFELMVYLAYRGAGLETNLTENQIVIADIDCNGQVDTTDMYYLMYYLALKGAGKNPSWNDIC